MAFVSIKEVFRAGRLQPRGPVDWGEPIPAQGPGVYMIALADRKEIARIGQKIVYVGRTRRSLRRRLAEFYRHEYGAPSPHRGGQSVLLLEGGLLVYWAATSKWADAEHKILQYFETRVGSLPWANRVRSARES